MFDLTYIKKPVGIVAEFWDGSRDRALEIETWFKQNVPANVTTVTYVESRPAYLLLDTPEGPFKLGAGWWIIRGVKGEYYGCRNDIFVETYEQDPETKAAMLVGIDDEAAAAALTEANKVKKLPATKKKAKPAE